MLQNKLFDWVRITAAKAAAVVFILFKPFGFRAYSAFGLKLAVSLSAYTLIRSRRLACSAIRFCVVRAFWPLKLRLSVCLQTLALVKISKTLFVFVL
jgi:hypothetical protein